MDAEYEDSARRPESVVKAWKGRGREREREGGGGGGREGDDNLECLCLFHIIWIERMMVSYRKDLLMQNFRQAACSFWCSFEPASRMPARLVRQKGRHGLKQKRQQNSQ